MAKVLRYKRRYISKFPFLKTQKHEDTNKIKFMPRYEIKTYLFACWRVYGILRTLVPGPKHPLANKLFDMFGVNHGAERLWLIPWHVA